MGEPELLLTVSRKVVTDSTPLEVNVVGTAGDGAIGTGTVKLTTSAGSVTPEVQLDAFGTGNAQLICDPATSLGRTTFRATVWTPSAAITSVRSA